MSDLTKINSTHLSRLACVYLRQSSAAQVEHNRESTARQYALVTKAAELGWPAQQVLVIDEDATGRRKRQTRKLPPSEWSVLIPEHHTGFIDWATYEANRSRIAANAHPQPHHSGGAARKGSALLQGLASCGACGRRLRTHYTCRTASPGYHCAGKNIVDGRGIYCLSVGAVQIDGAVARAVLAALSSAGLEAALAAAEQLEADRDDALAQCRLAAERARYEAQRAERRYRAVDAENRLVARG